MAKSIVNKIMNKEEPSKGIDLNKVVDYIYDAQFEMSTKGGFTKKKTFSPSTLVFGHGLCPRYWYLAFEGNEWEDKNTGQSYANMLNGSKSHERLQEALEKSGKLLWSEQTITSQDPPIFGYADAMVDIDGEPVLLEIKTTKEDAFQYHKNNRHISKYHLEQLLVYMKILKQKVGAILYENKNDNELLIIKVEPTQKHIDFIDYFFDWMRRVYSAWTNKTLPERGYRQGSKICAGCPIEKICDSREKGDVKIERRKEIEV